MNPQQQNTLHIAVPKSDRVLLQMSAGVTLLTVLMTVGIEHRAFWGAGLLFAGIFGGPVFLLLAAWELWRYAFRWPTALAALLAAVSSTLAWGTVSLMLTGYLW